MTPLEFPMQPGDVLFDRTVVGDPQAVFIVAAGNVEDDGDDVEYQFCTVLFMDDVLQDVPIYTDLHGEFTITLARYQP